MRVKGEETMRCDFSGKIRSLRELFEAHRKHFQATNMALTLQRILGIFFSLLDGGISSEKCGFQAALILFFILLAHKL